MVTAVHDPHPSTAERVIAEFADTWEIWREVLPGGRHGDWVARRAEPDGEREERRARTITALADLLRSGQ